MNTIIQKPACFNLFFLVLLYSYSKEKLKTWVYKLEDWGRKFANVSIIDHKQKIHDVRPFANKLGQRYPSVIGHIDD